MKESISQASSFCLSRSDLLSRIEKSLNGQLEGHGVFLASIPYQEARQAFNQLTSISRIQVGSHATNNNVEYILNPIDLPSDKFGTRELNILRALWRWTQESNFFVKHCIIHGSLACGEQTLYSDVDALLIVFDEVFTNPIIFAHARRNICYILRQILTYDPLQHHGFHIIPESVLLFYPSAYLPVYSFNDARVLGTTSNVTLNITLANDSNETSNRFEKIVDSISHQTIRPTTLYLAKLFLSSFMLLPALALQVEGHEVTKKQSFKKFSHRFTEQQWDAMLWATRMRAGWPKVELTNIERIALAVTNPWLISRLLIMRRPLPTYLSKEWTQTRHDSLLAFAQLAYDKTVQCKEGIVTSVMSK